MSYSICIYCPDTHLQYNGRTPDSTGVGGGITTRIRLATHLAQRGHSVRMICNCDKVSRYKNVEYIPLSGDHQLDDDVIILTTSGGALDLSQVDKLNIQSKTQYVWVQGIVKPEGLDQIPYKFLCCPSNFIRSTAMNDWGVSKNRIFVCYNGVEFSEPRIPLLEKKVHRNPYALVYSSHPSKGLPEAIQITKLLHQRDRRFHINIYGGNQLWGGAEIQPAAEDGIYYHGMVGQKALGAALKATNISLNLQARPEPFGISLTESMINGNIPIASPVGAYPELINTGYNGFLIEGAYTEPSVHEEAADLILNLTNNPEYAEYIRFNAANLPYTWDRIAAVWEQHWMWQMSLEDSKKEEKFSFQCPECSDTLLCMADGYHCKKCGRYFTSPNQSRINQFIS